MPVFIAFRTWPWTASENKIPARKGDRLQSGSNVDGNTKKIAVPNHHIANMNAHSKIGAVVRLELGFGEGLLRC
jgi:hypothetical protein